MDTLSDVLRGVKLTGAVFLHAECSAPWCVGVPTAGMVAQFLMPSAEHLVRYHLVTDGRCTIMPDGGAPEKLESGEIVILPHDESHLIGSDLHLPPASLEALGQRPSWKQLPLVRYGGGETTTLVCGFLACDPRLCRPILSALPNLLKVNIRSSPAGAWIENSVRYAADQATSPRPGGDTAVDCARSAVRQGARDVTIAYRRGLEQMRASPKEIAAAREEGVNFAFHKTPELLVGEENLRGVCFKDGAGGHGIVHACDVAIVAFGQEADDNVWLKRVNIATDDRGYIVTDEYGRTTHAKVFVGGDNCHGPDLVVTAIAAGRRASQGIKSSLQ